MILCKSREEAESALALVQQWVSDEELMLHPTKTKIVDARTEGFEFLLSLPGQTKIAAEEKSYEIQRIGAGEDETHERADMPFICARLSRNGVAGSLAFAIVNGRYFAIWMAGFATACAASCARGYRNVAVPFVSITNVGRTLSSNSTGCTA